MAKKPVLGDAFDSIFDDIDGINSDINIGGIQTLRIGEIEPNRNQPRREFDETALKQLADSIVEHGIIQPIIVREIGGGMYQIVAGERRWRAARIAGLEEVPVRIMELSDLQTMQIALIENIQREDLNPVEEAIAYKELIETHNMTQEHLSKIMGKARTSITNSLRLLTLPDEILTLLKEERLSKGHCKAIMQIPSSSKMIALAKKVEEEALSVRETEQLAKAISTSINENAKPPKPKRLPPQKKPFYREVEISLSETLNSNVVITETSSKKTLSIDFEDDDELNKLIKAFITD